MKKSLDNKDKRLLFETEGMAAEERKETIDFKLVEKLSLQQHCEGM